MTRRFTLRLSLVLTWLILAGLIGTACNFTGADTSEAEGVRTWLLVSAPDRPLSPNTPIEVKSRTQDSENFVSHVELYAVELPSGESDVLIRSDPAPFRQTTFTASQIFVPTQPGHYVIKVVGYNRLGDKMESDFLGFDVQ